MSGVELISLTDPEVLRLPSKDEDIDLVIGRRQAVFASIAKLPDNEKFILIRYFGLDGEPSLLIREIALMCNKSTERTRQVLCGALLRLGVKSPLLRHYANPRAVAIWKEKYDEQQERDKKLYLKREYQQYKRINLKKQYERYSPDWRILFLVEEDFIKHIGRKPTLSEIEDLLDYKFADGEYEKLEQQEIERQRSIEEGARFREENKAKRQEGKRLLVRAIRKVILEAIPGKVDYKFVLTSEEVCIAIDFLTLCDPLYSVTTEVSHWVNYFHRNGYV